MIKTLICIASTNEVPEAMHLENSVVVTTGIGMLNSSTSLQKAIEKYQPQRVLNIGTCGATTGVYGTVTLISGATQLFQEEFRSFAPPIYFNRHGLYNHHIFTSDVFITSETSHFVPNSINLFDMECYALARICLNHSLPFASIKIISDTIEHNIQPNDWVDRAINLKEQIKLLIEHLSIFDDDFVVPTFTKVPTYSY